MRGRAGAEGIGTMSTSRRGLAIVVVAIVAGVAWGLWRPLWPSAVRDWLAQDIPWLARLLGSWEAILALAGYWVFLRDPRCGPGVLACWSLFAVITLFELHMGWILALALAVLAAVALMARPWPNRTIMARCAALAGLAVAIEAVAS